jgi:hypothetical protein
MSSSRRFTVCKVDIDPRSSVAACHESLNKRAGRVEAGRGWTWLTVLFASIGIEIRPAPVLYNPLILSP